MPETDMASLPPCPPDPWSNYRAFYNLAASSPVDVLAFTERRLLADHWDIAQKVEEMEREDQHIQSCEPWPTLGEVVLEVEREERWEMSRPNTGRRYDKNVPRTFWEQIQSCEPLKALCVDYSSKHFNAVTGYPPYLGAVERLHAVIDLLECFHRREAGFGSPIRRGQAEEPTRKQLQREWEVKLRGLKRAASILEDMPDLLLTAEEREQLSKILLPATEKAAQFAKNPPRPGVRLVLAKLAPDGTRNPHVVDILPTFPEPPKKGRFRKTGIGIEDEPFTFNLQTALVDEFLLPLTKGKRRWKLLLDLLRHFNPENFTRLSPHAIRNRVQWFRKEHLESVQRHKRRSLHITRDLIRHRPA